VSSPAPPVEFLWWRECPSWERALADLREVMEELGLDPAAIEMIEVGDEDDAERQSFIGSPTIRVDGVDVDPPEADEPHGLSCRIYRRREDGRVSPLPDREVVREALQGAIERKESVS
jgi:8-oxo-dGTP pyrophosphatase MutT (NUDIX family)